jgi:hypothetical protein
MSARDAIRMRITSAMALLLLQGLPRPQARREASKQVAHEMRQERAERARVQPRPVPTGPITLASAKSMLVARIGRMITNLHHALPQQLNQALGLVVPTGTTSDPIPAQRGVPVLGHLAEPTPPLTSDPTLAEAFPPPLVITSGGAQLIPDSEFHTSMHDRTTENWRRSILDAQERERRRANRWIG